MVLVNINDLLLTSVLISQHLRKWENIPESKSECDLFCAAVEVKQTNKQTEVNV